jgi:hypothetical protein
MKPLPLEKVLLLTPWARGEDYRLTQQASMAITIHEAPQQITTGRVKGSPLTRPVFLECVETQNQANVTLKIELAQRLCTLPTIS